MLDLNVVIRDVRSFAGRHVIPVKPLTIVVGENSSGKSTFLAVLSALLDPTGFPFQPVLNKAPYDLGGFENMLTSIRRRGERPTDFAFGCTYLSQRSPANAIATYTGARGQVQLAHFLLETGHGSITLSAKDRGMGATVRLNADKTHPETLDVELSFDSPALPVDLFSFVMMGIYRWSTDKEKVRDLANLQERLFHLLQSLPTQGQPPFSIAPIRTKPRRTYDQATESFSPEGDHIPILLSRILSDDDKRAIGTELRQALATFGRDSGLFRSVGVRRLGSKPNDPFQVRVAMPGRASNLVDVGYGVSQALPVIVESVVSTKAKVLLLQQPEVHLHPRAQAALGTFFANLVGSHEKQFVIETHSDYLIDRIRQEIAAKRLKPELVSFLFFELAGGVTKVHRIEIDALGNLVKTPRRYREFFLNEKRRLLSRGQ